MYEPRGPGGTGPTRGDGKRHGERALNNPPPRLEARPGAALRRDAEMRLWRQRRVERLCWLGSRAVFDFVDEIARYYPTVALDLDRRLARFAALDPALLRQVGGDRFPSSPLRRAPRCRRRHCPVGRRCRSPE
jgi:hypothetical protein